jgi:hypothetical protein
MYSKNYKFRKIKTINLLELRKHKTMTRLTFGVAVFGMNQLDLACTQC